MKLTCKLALSSCGRDINEELFRAYAEAGIEAMELSLGYDDCEVFDFEAAEALSKQYSVALHSFHIPFSPFDRIDISRPELAAGTVDMAKTYMAKGSAVGIRVFVIHPSGEPIAEEDRPRRMACAKESLSVLAEYAQSLGVTVAVEDLPRTCLGNCSADILELISAHPALGVCFDTNHLLGEDIVDFIRAVGPRIVTTHVSDYDFINERHWLPGEGLVDWTALADTLGEVGYAGYWLYELGLDCPWSIDRPRDLTYRDFKANFDAIMAGERPVSIGKAKKNLGMWRVEG